MSEKTELIVGEAKLRVKNQATIPQEVCSLLGISPGDFLRWERRNGSLVMVKSVTVRTTKKV